MLITVVLNRQKFPISVWIIFNFVALVVFLLIRSIIFLNKQRLPYLSLDHFYYHPPMKLRKGNVLVMSVSQSVIDSVHRVGPM